MDPSPKAAGGAGSILAELTRPTGDSAENAASSEPQREFIAASAAGGRFWVEMARALAGAAVVLPAPVFLLAAMKTAAEKSFASAAVPGAILLLYLGWLLLTRRYTWADASLYGMVWRSRLADRLDLKVRPGTKVRFPIDNIHLATRGVFLVLLLAAAWILGAPKIKSAVQAVEHGPELLEAARAGAFREPAPPKPLTQEKIKAALQAATAGDFQQLKTLVDADPRLAIAANAEGQTPLHWAARGGHMEAAILLLARKADPNAAESLGGATPLHWAAAQGQVSALAKLLDSGGKVDVQAKDGRTPLHAAVFALQRPAVELLLQRGADINARDAKGQTPLRFAEERRDAAMKSFLMKRGARV
jgi:hypothetical protein